MTLNENEKFVLSELWSKKLKDYLRSFYKTIYFGPLAFVLLNVIFCFALQGNITTNFWVLFIPITILSTIYCILMPRKAINQYKNIIQTFELKGQNELILTLLEGKVLTLTYYNITDTYFSIGNTKKASKLVTDKNSGFEYTLIPEFFADFPAPNWTRLVTSS